MRILVVEDDEGMGIVISHRLRMLRDKFPESEIVLVTTMDAARKQLAGIPWPDIVIADLTLPDSTLEATVAAMREVDRYSPVILLTGNPSGARAALIDGDEMEIVSKDGGTFTGPNLFEAIARAWIRFCGRNDRLRQNIDRMRELISSHASPN